MINPFCMLVAGSSQTGKTKWVCDLLKQRRSLFTQAPGPIHVFYREWQAIFEELEDAHFHQTMPTMQSLKALAHQNATVVIDDMIHHVTRETAELFTVGSSRYRANIIFITQNLFDKNPFFRTISLNCKYICIRKNPRDSSSIMHFAKQVVPANSRFLVQVYRDVTSQKAFSYLFFDASQQTREMMRLRTNILSEGGQPMQCFNSDRL